MRVFGSGVTPTVLAPRQPLAPTPYALFAATAGTVPDGAITAPKLAGGAAAENLRAGGLSGVASGGVVLSEQASAADLATVNLSLHAQLAMYYFQARSLDAQEQLLNSTVAHFGPSILHLG